MCGEYHQFTTKKFRSSYHLAFTHHRSPTPPRYMNVKITAKSKDCGKLFGILPTKLTLASRRGKKCFLPYLWLGLRRIISLPAFGFKGTELGLKGSILSPPMYSWRQGIWWISIQSPSSCWNRVSLKPRGVGLSMRGGMIQSLGKNNFPAFIG